MDLKGSKTEANLWAAFAGESQARNKYTYYAQKAREEGYVGIAKIFEETAGNEREHAKLWFDTLGQINTTSSNLKDAAEGEHYEWTEMYPGFAATAKEEGFSAIAFAFKKAADVEQEHEARYKELLENVLNDKVFEKEEEEVWICSNCGHVHKGKKALGVCPLCKFPQAYFEIKAKTY